MLGEKDSRMMKKRLASLRHFVLSANERYKKMHAQPKFPDQYILIPYVCCHGYAVLFVLTWYSGHGEEWKAFQCCFLCLKHALLMILPVFNGYLAVCIVLLHCVMDSLGCSHQRICSNEDHVLVQFSI